MKYVLIVIVLVSGLLLYPKLDKKGLSPADKNFISMYESIKKAPIPKGVIVCRKPQLCYYYSGFKSVSYPFTTKPDSMFNFLIKYDYIIADNYFYTSMAYLNPVVDDSMKYFKILGFVGDKIVFLEIRKEMVVVLKVVNNFRDLIHKYL